MEPGPITLSLDEDLVIYAAAVIASAPDPLAIVRQARRDLAELRQQAQSTAGANVVRLAADGTIRYGDRAAKLTPTEAGILTYLGRYAGQRISANELHEAALPTLPRHQLSQTVVSLRAVLDGLGIGGDKLKAGRGTSAGYILDPHWTIVSQAGETAERAEGRE